MAATRPASSSTPSPWTMQQIAADIGKSETAFVTEGDPYSNATVRLKYFPPRPKWTSVPAAIAAGVALGEVHGPASSG